MLHILQAELLRTDAVPRAVSRQTVTNKILLACGRRMATNLLKGDLQILPAERSFINRSVFEFAMVIQSRSFYCRPSNLGVRTAIVAAIEAVAAITPVATVSTWLTADSCCRQGDSCSDAYVFFAQIFSNSYIFRGVKRKACITRSIPSHWPL